MKERSEYFQSDEYWKDVREDEEKRKLRQKKIKQAKQKVEAEERPLFVGYFFGNQNTDTSSTKKVKERSEESKIQERSAAKDSADVSSTKGDVVVQKKGRKKKRKNYK